MTAMLDDHTRSPSIPSSRSRDRRIKIPTVQNQIMPDDEPDLRRAQERTRVPELRRIADAARVRPLGAFLHQFIDRPVAGACRLPKAATQPVGQERSG